MAGEVVTIETGLACNNRCLYCPQPAIRASAGAIVDPRTEELRQKVAQARRSGFDEIAFSGGEPSIRKDLPELVRYARTLGFKRVSITTNGRMFVYPEFTRRMVAAGLTGVSVSLHGPDADTHDRLTGVPGSFRQALTGLANLRKIADEGSGRFDITSITILVPENIDRIRDTLVLAGSMGATLHVVQPFILSRETLHLGSRFLLTRDQIVHGLEAALAEPLPHGGRVKPYNIPPCLLTGLGSTIEIQEYRLNTFREYEDELGSYASRRVSGQFYRDESCNDCKYYCPGLRIEHVTDTDAADMILEDTDHAYLTGLPDSLIVSSTDLLGPAGLDRLLAGLQKRKARHLTLTWGGFARTSAEDFMELCRGRGVDEVISIVVPSSLRPPDRRVWLPGNTDRLKSQMSLFTQRTTPVPSLFVVLNALFSGDCRLSEETVIDLLGFLRTRGGSTLYLAAPEGLDALAPPHDDAFKDVVMSALPRLVERIRTLGVEPVVIRTNGAPVDPEGRLLESMVARVIPEMSWTTQFLEHRFAGVEFGWVMWSYPIWTRHFTAGDSVAQRAHLRRV